MINFDFRWNILVEGLKSREVWVNKFATKKFAIKFH
jgi:hypothetical protein